MKKLVTVMVFSLLAISWAADVSPREVAREAVMRIQTVDWENLWGRIESWLIVIPEKEDKVLIDKTNEHEKTF